MQLNITENDTDTFGYDSFNLETTFENIPENIPINQNESSKKIKNNIHKNQQITYEDILNKMNMCVSNGKLYLTDRQTQQTLKNTQIQQKQKQQIQPEHQLNHMHNNSYIYNKYFKNEFNQPTPIKKPKTIKEYKLMLLQEYIQRHRIKQIKSKRIVIPSSTINFSENASQANLNRLFNFSNR